jgi:hypothetical protein
METIQFCSTIQAGELPALKYFTPEALESKHLDLKWVKLGKMATHFSAYP